MMIVIEIRNITRKRLNIELVKYRKQNFIRRELLVFFWWLDYWPILGIFWWQHRHYNLEEIGQHWQRRQELLLCLDILERWFNKWNCLWWLDLYRKQSQCILRRLQPIVLGLRILPSVFYLWFIIRLIVWSIFLRFSPKNQKCWRWLQLKPS